VRTIVLPDIHYPKHDPAALRWALRYVNELQPRRVILLGDVINLDAVSRFPMPSRVVTNFPTEIRKYRAFYQRLVRRLPRDQRLQSYLVKRAPALAELPDLQLKEFLRLPKSWKIIPYPTGIWEEQGVICMHGQKYSQSCVQRYIKFGCSTVSGHSHIASLSMSGGSQMDGRLLMPNLAVCVKYYRDIALRLLIGVMQ